MEEVILAKNAYIKSPKEVLTTIENISFGHPHIPSGKHPLQSNSSNYHGKLGCHINKQKLRTLPCSVELEKHHQQPPYFISESKKRSKDYLSNRVVIKSDLFTVSNRANAVYSNLVLTIHCSNSAKDNRKSFQDDNPLS